MTEADPTLAYQPAEAPSVPAFGSSRRAPAPSEGPAPADPRPVARRSTHAERELEFRLILAELDAIHRLLGVPDEPGAPRTPRADVAAAADPARTDPRRPVPEARGAPSPYLDDRLAGAREAAADISTEFEAIQQRTQGLGSSMATLQAELERASEELAFLRTGPGLEPPAVVGPISGRAPSTERADPSARPPTRAAPVAAPAAYGAFTVARYNETMREVHKRRPWLFGSTLLLAAVISAALVLLAFVAHEAMPVWWMAGLPLVWMIPVPFFLVSFVSTHRILSTHSLELPEAS